MSELNVNASEFVSTFASQSSQRSSQIYQSPPMCHLNNWWYENKSMFDESYDDLKKIFGESKVPVRNLDRTGELRKLNVDRRLPSKKFTTPLMSIKEVKETSMTYASIVLKK
jgi:hypothetical protein